MESIKRYFRSLLIGLATLILSNLQPNNPNLHSNKGLTGFEDDDDIQMYI